MPKDFEIDSQTTPTKGKKGQNLISTATAAEILGVTQSKILAWLKDGTLSYARTYRNQYSGTSYLLDRQLIESQETKSRLADKIAQFERHQSAGKKATNTQVEKARTVFEQYLDRIQQAAPNPQVAQLLLSGYYLWHLNHIVKAKNQEYDERQRLYSYKDKILAALWQTYADTSRVKENESIPGAFSLEGAALQADKQNGTGNDLEGISGSATATTITARLNSEKLSVNEGQANPVIILERVRSKGFNFHWRHYLSFVLFYPGFRFPFHTPWDKAETWLPPELQAKLQVRTWEKLDEPFTFGGRAITWVEGRAIPKGEILNRLAEIYQQITGKSQLEFLSYNSVSLVPHPYREQQVLYEDEDEDNYY